MNPDKQDRAQKEIDNVVGSHRLPTLGDKDSLPYVEALIKESMRWHPPVPLSMPTPSQAIMVRGTELSL